MLDDAAAASQGACSGDLGRGMPAKRLHWRCWRCRAAERLSMRPCGLSWFSRRSGRQQRVELARRTSRSLRSWYSCPMFMRIGSAGSRWGSLNVLLLALLVGLAGCGEQAVPEPSPKPGSSFADRAIAFGRAGSRTIRSTGHTGVGVSGSRCSAACTACSRRSPRTGNALTRFSSLLKRE